MTALDETQFLSRNESVASPDWIRRHSIKIRYADGVHESSTAWVKVTNGQITQASEKDTTIISYLTEHGWIESCHVECALSFMELKHCYTAKNGLKSNSVYLSKFIDGGNIRKDETERAYEFISKKLGRRGERIVEYACTHLCDLKSGCHTESANNVYRNAMGILLSASDEIWRIIQDERLKNAVV